MAVSSYSLLRILTEILHHASTTNSCHTFTSLQHLFDRRMAEKVRWLS